MTSRNNNLSSSLASRKRRLNKARKELKSHFVGLDEVIDEVITCIEPWYTIPDILTRPIILNLWGITGVGKTDLIERLVVALGVQDIFIKTSLNRPSFTISSSVFSMYSPLSSGSPGVMFFDEFQDFRTKDKKGMDKGEALLDFWKLLSDGKLDLRYKAEIYCAICKESAKELEKKAKKKWGTSELLEIKYLFNIEESLDEIREWPLKRFARIFSKTKKDKLRASFDCSKCLIIIAGNLDEAYWFSNEVAEVALDADEFHEMSKEISFLEIKQALVKRFKPEQIARLGNNHILYPALSKKNYEDLIYKIIEDKKNLVKENYRITLTIDKSVFKLIYNNGVFPAQGVRPVLTTAANVIDSVTPAIVMHCKENSSHRARLSYDRPYLVSKIYVPGEEPLEVRTKYNDRMHIINKRLNRDELAATAVHEAGHAVSFALLTKVAPLRMKLTPNSVDGMFGYVRYPKMDTSEELLDMRIKSTLAGRAAEKVVFGDTLMTAGATSDIYYATYLCSLLVRRCGLKGTLPMLTRPESDWDAISSYTNTDNSNAEIEKIISRADEEIEDLLQDNKKFLVAVSKHLLKTGDLTQKQFIKLCKKYKVRGIKESNFLTKVTSPYDKLLSEES